MILKLEAINDKNTFFSIFLHNADFDAKNKLDDFSIEFVCSNIDSSTEALIKEIMLLVTENNYLQYPGSTNSTFRNFQNTMILLEGSKTRFLSVISRIKMQSFLLRPRSLKSKL